MTQIINTDVSCEWVKYDKKIFHESWKPDDELLYLFKIKIGNFKKKIGFLESFLTTDELQRANKYYKLEDKNRFIVCRSILRLVLGKFSSLEPNEVILKSSNTKKPFFHSYPSIKFNISHTRKYGLLAISNEEVGVDVELNDESYNFKLVIPSVLNEAEISQINISNEPSKEFFKYWTRKEAFTKLIGTGIDDTVTSIPTQNGKHLIPRLVIKKNESISVLSFNIGKSHIGSLATLNKKNVFKNLRCYIIDDIQSF
ncbi:MAG: 4'-phosphopantetheinyl transferase superfamily protein [Bacteroidota bacterium]